MRKRFVIFSIVAVVAAPIIISPMPKFNKPFSTVVESRDGSIIGARIAKDGQWRFSPSENVSEKFEKALIVYEDRWFRYHAGINPVSIFRAFIGNIKAGKTVRGGSTISMQVARLSQENRGRTYFAKLTEILSALKLEIFRSKNKILLMYASNAPFGGNIVGIEAASWRYSGKSSSELSWAEAAALAILPNSPALIYPGKNQEILKTKRDKLLGRLLERAYIDSLTYSLAIDEPLPTETIPAPANAPHLTDYFFKFRRGRTIRTTIDKELQQQAQSALDNWQKTLAENNIFNSACVILEVKTGNVAAYIGNSLLPETKMNGGDVDIIRSKRSSGSILKPFLYAAMQQSGEILPNSLIADIPTRFQGFTPENFNKSYGGAVPAGYALSQSLNIPAVKMLQKYNVDRFLSMLKRTGFSTFNKSADHYGLSLILGGGEISLWELAGAYASLSRALNNFCMDKKYFIEDYHEPVLILDERTNDKKHIDNDPPYNASAIWLTYEALLKVNRPESETGWQFFSSSVNMAWKTGTSYGFRDAWAVGTTPEYVIGVWAGNADGEGRPGLTGVSAAAPLLFELARLVKSSHWFETPYDELEKIKVCRQSGFKAGVNCPETIEIDACAKGILSETCPYHHIVHLNKQRALQATTECLPAEEIINEPWFILTPAMEYFYKQYHADYKPLPPYMKGCNVERSIPAMEFIYPAQGVKIFIPRDHEGNRTRVIAEVAHRNPARKIFWHLDNSYIGATKYIHHIEIFASGGDHILTVVDEDGFTVKSSFKVVETNRE